MEKSLPSLLYGNTNSKRNIRGFFKKISLTCFVSALVFLMGMVPGRGNAQMGVDITAPTLTVKACGSFSTPETTLGNIVISETSETDIVNFGTLILTAPTNFEFTSAGTGTFVDGKNVTDVTTELTNATTITVTIAGAGIDQLDKITLDGIKVRGINAESGPSNVTRNTLNPGDAVILGDEPGTAHASVTSVLNPIPVVNSVGNKIYCEGAATPAINFGSDVSSSTYAWTSTVDVGFGTSGNGNIPAFTATNSTNSAITAAVSVIATSNGCASAPETFSVTSNPAPTITGTPTVCVNSTTQLTGSGTPATTNPWTSSKTSVATVSSTGLVTGVAAGTSVITYTNDNGCQQTITVTVNAQPTITGTPTVCVNSTTQLTGSGTPATTNPWASSKTSVATVSATGLITGVAAGTSVITYTNDNGCSKTFSITVNPTATVTKPTDQTVCTGASTAAVTFGGSAVTGTTYSWTNNTTSIGLAASGTGDIASFTATNTGTAPVTATITVTPTANGCPGTPQTFAIKVNSTATVTKPTDQTVCNGAATTAVTFGGSTVTGTTYNWTNNTTSIGLGASGTGDIIASFTATNTGTAPVTATIRVTPTANGCPGTPQAFTITVNPAATVTKPTDQTVCNGASTAAVTFTGVPTTGVTYNWTNNTTSIGLGATGTGNIAPFTATNTGTSPVIATITVIPTSNGCTGQPQTFTITVNPTVGTPAAITVSAGSEPTCQIANTTTTTTYSTTASGSTGFTWSLSNSAAGTITASATDPSTAVMKWTNVFSGTVNIQVTASNSCGTSAMTSRTVTFGTPPAPVITSTTPIICLGNIATLTVSSYPNPEVFNETWQSSNNWKHDGGNISGNGSNTTILVWSGVTDKKVLNGTQLRSNDQSKFVAAAGSITSLLTSPVFSSVGMLSANIQFFQAIKLGANDSAKVEISTNGSAGPWITLQKYSSGTSFGTPNFTPTTIPFNNYVGYPNLMLRFNYVAPGNTGFWAMDNLTVNGVYPTVTSTWSSSPSNGGLYTDAGATNAYTGTNTMTVYAKPSATGTYNYTVTASTGSGCSNSSSAFPITVNPLATLSGVLATAACSGSSAAVTLNGLLNNSTSNVSYKIGSGSIQTINGVISNGSGVGTFQLNTVYANNGQALKITSIASSIGSGPACSQTFTTNNSTTLTVYPTSVGGTITGGSTVCTGSNSGTLTLSGYTGNITKWQSSTVSDFSSNVTEITNNTSPSQTFTNLTATTTYYRAVIASGSCPSINSSTATVTTVAQLVSGTLTPSPAAGQICSGTSVSATAAAGSGGAGTTADVIQYRFDGGTWQNYTPGASLSTTGHTSVDIQTFRTSSVGGCNQSTPAIKSWTITAQPVSGTLTETPAAGSVCSGTSVLATAAAGSGGAGTTADVTQYRFDGGTWQNYTPGASLSTTGHTSVDIQTFRTSSVGGCNQSTPAIKSWTIVAQPVSGTLTETPAAGSVCSGTNVSATATTGSGGAGTTADVTKYRFDGGTWQTYTPGASLATTGHISVDIQTYRTSSVGGCSSSTPVVKSWTINTPPAVASNGQPVSTSACPGSTTSFTVNATGTSLTYQWQVNTNGGNNFTDITDNTIYQGVATAKLTITGAPTIYSGYKYRVIVTGASSCSPVISDISTLTLTDNIWRGITSVKWDNVINWACNIPLTGDDVFVPDTAKFMPQLVANTTVGSLTLQLGTTLDLNDKTLTIDSTLSGAGRFIGSDASGLTLNGVSSPVDLYFSQATNATTNVLDNLTITKSITVNLNDSVYITGTLAPNGSTINTGDNLTLRSTGITATARVAVIAAGGKINGDVTVERFFTRRRAFRLVSPSVTTTTDIRTNWMEGVNDVSTTSANRNKNPHPGFGTHITGSGGHRNNFDETISNNPSIFTFDNINQSYSAVPDPNGKLIAGFPYRLMVRGSRSVDLNNDVSDSSVTILRAKGTLFTGSLTYSTASNTVNSVRLKGTATKFSLIGNPYASPVDWEKMVNVNPASKATEVSGTAYQITPSYYTYDPYVGTRGIYVAYNAILGDNSVLGGTGNDVSKVDKNIQSGQAFFIQSTGTNPSLAFLEDYKTSGNTRVFRVPAVRPKLAVQLLLNTNAGKQNTADGLIAYFDDQFSKAIGNEDSYKFTNMDENLAINNLGTALSIEGRPTVTADDTIPLMMWQLKSLQKEYYLKLTASNFSPEVTAFVKDNYLHTETPVDLASATLHPFSIDTAVAASVAKDRFSIVFKLGKALPVTLTNIKAYQKDNGIQVDWTAEAETNIDRYEVEKSADGQKFDKATAIIAKGNNAATQTYGWLDENANTGSNFYRIKVTEKSGAVKYSNIARVNIDAANSSLTVLPNPIKNNLIKLQFKNMEKGRYSAVLYNTLGQKLFSTNVEHTARSGTYTISLGKLISKGSYTLHITKGDTTINEKVIVE